MELFSNNNRGFTLIELLFVLLIVSIVSLLALPSMYNMYKDQQTKQFFSLLDSDILYVQNQAMAGKRNCRVVFDNDSYSVLSEDKLISQRSYPEHMRYRNVSTNRIVFNDLGSARNVTTYLFYADHDMYQIVFPLGKGRHYIEQH